MKNNFDNIITISGTSDNLFDKAIFVLKPELQPDTNSLDFVKEADRILNNYMLKAVTELQQTKPNPNILVHETTPKIKTPTKTKAQSKKLNNLIDRILILSILFCCVAVMYLLMIMWANGKTIFNYNK